jgi:hypothetical protein
MLFCIAVQLLLEYRADASAVDKSNRLPIHYAAVAAVVSQSSDAQRDALGKYQRHLL